MHDIVTRTSHAAGVEAARPDREAERAQLKVLAQEFEALLMNELLADWRRSLLAVGDDENADEGLGTMVDMVGSEFGRALSRSGGLGIAAELLRAFDRRADSRSSQGPSGSGTETPPVDRASIPSAASAAREAFAGEVSPVTGSVSSPFGWRRDPLSGQVKFHAGADIRMAYGEEVASVAGGRVSFAGEQGSYGLTVVVDHVDGLQTRYAHLSSALVSAGETVTPGQPIARAGNSGRSTGPHLHVELLKQGQPTDPAQVLKGVKGNADWTAYRSALAASVQGLATRGQE